MYSLMMDQLPRNLQKFNVFKNKDIIVNHMTVVCICWLAL